MSYYKKLKEIEEFIKLAESKGEMDDAKAALAQYEELKKLDPTNGMSAADRFWAGMGKAFMDTGRGVGNLFGLVSDEDIEESRQNDQALMDTGWGMVGNIGGHAAQFALPGSLLTGAGKLANSAKLMNAGRSMIAPKSITAATAAGASYGAIQPGDRLENAAMGGIGGGIGQGLIGGISKTLAPKISESVRGLLDQGIPLTPGMTLGGGFRKAEEALTSFPIFGSAIEKTQTEAVKGLNKAAWNRVLKPIGDSLPDGVEGREAVRYASDSVKTAYNQLLPNMKAQIDPEFMGDITTLKQMAGVDTLPDDIAAQFDKILNREVLGKFTSNGLATGEVLKTIESQLGKHASRYYTSTDANQRALGGAFKELQSSLRRLLERSNPDHADQLKAINQSFAMLDKVKHASKSVAAEEGVFTPAQLHNAVKARDNSFGKNRFAEGEALLQDLSEPAKSVMTGKLNESGTASRLFHAGGGLAGMAYDPGATLGLLGGSAIYGAKPTQDLIRAALTARPNSVKQLGLLVDKTRPLGTALGSGMGLGSGGLLTDYLFPSY